ncbi:MAG: hypothetical protein HDS42_06105 [Bacteroides sp.]|nr:hypothetical protein [Bacteroides sp.]
MKGKRFKTYDNIELRSPKVRKVLEETPYKLERWGVIIICVILIALIISVVKINYPYSGGESILEHIFGF